MATLCAPHGQWSAGDDQEVVALIGRAAAVATTARALRPVKWRRWSVERDEEHELNGLVGSVTFEGALGEFLPLLRPAELLHVGKAAGNGLGKVVIETS